jgi:SAM-dependent methyltransferase
MTDRGDERAAQVAFHQHAEVARFTNRIENPYLRHKETTLAQFVAGHLQASHARLLEVGCGEGSNLWFLARERPTWRLFGVDLSPAKAAFLRAHVPMVGAAAADALRLPFADGAFDAVLCRDLLHHVNWDRGGVVSESLRVLRPGGYLLVLEGNGRTLLNRVFGLLYPAERGMKDSTPSSVRALLARYGEPALQFVEPSSVVRAAGFVFGWPRGIARVPAVAAYEVGTWWERITALALPRHRWVYMVITLQKRASAA